MGVTGASHHDGANPADTLKADCWVLERFAGRQAHRSSIKLSALSLSASVLVHRWTTSAVTIPNMPCSDSACGRM